MIEFLQYFCEFMFFLLMGIGLSVICAVMLGVLISVIKTMLEKK